MQVSCPEVETSMMCRTRLGRQDNCLTGFKLSTAMSHNTASFMMFMVSLECTYYKVL